MSSLVVEDLQNKKGEVRIASSTIAVQRASSSAIIALRHRLSFFNVSYNSF